MSLHWMNTGFAVIGDYGFLVAIMPCQPPAFTAIEVAEDRY